MKKPNLAQIEQICQGSESCKSRIIAILKKEFPIEAATYQQNIESGQLENCAENVHKLKHKISILGLEDAYKLAVSYEDELLEGITEKKAKFNLILDSISQFIKTL